MITKTEIIMKTILTGLLLLIGLTVTAQKTNVSKETKTTTVTVKDGTNDPKKLVKTDVIETKQDIELKDANSKKLNKDIKQTPVQVTETSTISGDFVPPMEKGSTIRYQLDGKYYVLATDEHGYTITSPQDPNTAILRKASNNSYIYRTKERVSLSYFNKNGDLVIETYDEKADAITVTTYTRVKE